MTTSAEPPEDDLRARIVDGFLSGIRTAAVHRQHFGWSRAYSEWTLALCDRTEQLGLPGAYLVVEMCCAGREPLTFEDALVTVEAICQPATAS